MNDDSKLNRVAASRWSALLGVLVLCGCEPGPPKAEWDKYIEERSTAIERRRLDEEVDALRLKRAFWIGACFGQGTIGSNEVVQAMGKASPW